MQAARVAITGIGVIAPNGIGRETFWQTLRDGESGIGKVDLFDTTDFATSVGGQVRDFDPARYLRRPAKLRRMGRHTQFALVATQLALDDAGVNPWTTHEHHRIPVLVGVSIPAMDILEKEIMHLGETKNPRLVSPRGVNAAQAHSVAAELMEYLGRRFYARTQSSECPSGVDAVTHAAEMIRDGFTDLAIAGGTDAPLTPYTFACLSNIGLISMQSDAPENASRPYDRLRDTGVISEGAGFFVLENLDHARARGVEPYGLITGYASNVDPDPDASGSGLGEVMVHALANAGRHPDDVDYLCAHAPGHPAMDRVETHQIKQVFGRRAYRLAISSIKGVTGNAMAATGCHQLAAVCLALRHQTVPPTANLHSPDPECDLNYTPLRPRRLPLRCALLNSHGFGGGNTSLVVERSVMT